MRSISPTPVSLSRENTSFLIYYSKNNNIPFLYNHMYKYLAFLIHKWWEHTILFVLNLTFFF